MIVLGIIALVLIGFIILLAIVLLVADIWDYIDNRLDYAIILKFDSWIKIYEFNPGPWTLSHSYARYESDTGDVYIVQFTYWSTWQYKLWLSDKDTLAQRQRNAIETQCFLASIQRDIDKTLKKEQAK